MAELVHFRTPFITTKKMMFLKKITPFKEKCNVLTLMKEENRKMRYTIRSSVLLVKKMDVSKINPNLNYIE